MLESHGVASSRGLSQPSFPLSSSKLKREQVRMRVLVISSQQKECEAHDAQPSGASLMGVGLATETAALFSMAQSLFPSNPQARRNTREEC